MPPIHHKVRTTIFILMFIFGIILSIVIFFPKAVAQSLLEKNTVDFNEQNINIQNLNLSMHLQTPENVNALYMSSWVAGTSEMRANLVKIIENNPNLNAIVIDFKDSEGVVSLPAPDGASADRVASASKRVTDLKDFIQQLHAKNIYVIARIATFEDPIYAKNHPEQAVQIYGGKLWKDKHGLAWADPAGKVFYNYIKDLSLEAFNMGFDEINLDYVRFPTDGSAHQIYPIAGLDPAKEAVIKEFFIFMDKNIRQRKIPMSADVFGQIVSTPDGMGIGQHYEDILPYVDAICPMIYPSHFVSGYKNIKNPAEHPYEIISASMKDAIARRDAIGFNTVIRPWYQDFDLGAVYTREMVQDQIRAGRELGLKSYLIWDPKNKYKELAN